MLAAMEVHLPLDLMETHECAYCYPSKPQELSTKDKMDLKKGDLGKVEHFLDILGEAFRACDPDCPAPFAEVLHTESRLGQTTTESFLHILMWKSVEGIYNSKEGHNRFKQAMEKVLQFLEQWSKESGEKRERVRRLLALPGKQGKTVIHLAAMKWGNEVVRRLLHLGANIGDIDVLGEVAATRINPDLVEEFLDSKWDPHLGDPDLEDYSIEFDFGFLQAQDEKGPPMLLLAELAQSETHQRLLTHPVLTTFLALQWESLSIPFYLNLLLSTAAFTMANLVILRNYGGYSLQHLSLRTDWESCHKESFPSASQDPTLHMLAILLAIFTALLLLREGVQIVAEKFSYFCSLENWIELYFCISSFVLVGYSYSANQPVCHMRALAATIILASWVLLVNMVARHPRIQRVNIYITMFFKVMCYFVGIFLAFIPYIIAFGLFFYISLHKDEEDKNDLAPQKTYTDMRKQILKEINKSSVFLEKDKHDILKFIEDKAEEKGEFMNKAGSSIIKAMAMFVGELEFSDIPLEGLPYFSHLFFMIFIIIFVVVLMNYLTGIAVGASSPSPVLRR